jgi:hypothetical protein
MLSFFPDVLVRAGFLAEGEAPIAGSMGRGTAGEAAVEDMSPKKPPNWVTITISNTTPRDVAAITLVRFSAPNFTTPTSNRFRI